VQGASALSSNTTSFGGVFGFIANPDRVSFFGEIGVQGRWYSLSYNAAGSQQSASYSAPELLLGLGIWIPAGHTLRLLPEVTAGLGSFNLPNDPNNTNTPGHGFVMLGLGGFFNIDLGSQKMDARLSPDKRVQ
jgi:hypothetical protein